MASTLWFGIRLLTLATAGTFLLWSASSSATAEGEVPATSIIMPRALWETIERPAVLPSASLGPGSIFVMVDGRACNGWSFDSRANTVLENGDLVTYPGQPRRFDECTRDGAKVQLIVSNGRVLAYEGRMSYGTTLVIDNVEPEPIVPGSPTILSVASQVYTSSVVLEQFTHLDLFAGDASCGRLMLHELSEQDVDGNPFYRLDGPDLPDVCSQDGTTLKAVDQDGRVITWKPAVVEGGRTVFLGLGPEAPSSGGGDSPAGEAPDSGKKTWVLRIAGVSTAVLALGWLSAGAVRNRRTSQ